MAQPFVVESTYELEFEPVNRVQSKKSMSTTRSFYRCCVSNITLDPSEAFPFKNKVYHHELLQEWFQTFGPMYMPNDDKTDPDMIHELQSIQPFKIGNDNADIESLTLLKKISFIESECNRILSKVINERQSLEFQKQFLYIKVLIAWCVAIDVRGAIQILTKATKVCESMANATKQHLETLYVFFQNILSSLILSTDASKVILEIDETKTSITRLSVIDAALIRYVTTGILTLEQ
jgi:hypothetical protein